MKIWGLVPALLAIVLTGCGPSSSLYRGRLAAQFRDALAGKPEELFSYNHTLSLGMPQQAIKARYNRAEERCLRDTALHCRVISASIQSGTQAYENSSSASLIVALAHSKVAEFESSVIAPVSSDPNDAAVLSRSTSANNVTEEATDSARKVAQLSDYHERLAELAKRPNLSIDDLIKVEGELSKTQSDLDEANSRKNDVSERITKEQLSIFLEEQSGLTDAFRPVGRVWRDAVQLLGESTANAVQFLIQLIPWLPLIAGAFFLFRWLWRLTRKKTM